MLLEAIQSATHCPYCRGELDSTEVQCFGCETSYHRDCLEELGRCATLGCSGTAGIEFLSCGHPNARGELDCVTCAQQNCARCKESLEDVTRGCSCGRRYHLSCLTNRTCVHPPCRRAAQEARLRPAGQRGGRGGLPPGQLADDIIIAVFLTALVLAALFGGLHALV